MLIEYSVTNYRSIRDTCTLSMEPLEGTDSRFIDSRGYLTVCSIYGANGSGKSMILESIEFLRRLVTANEVGKAIPDMSFRFDDNRNNTKFKICFDVSGTEYIYSLETGSGRVLSEELLASGISVFTRDHDDIIFPLADTNEMNVLQRMKQNQDPCLTFLMSCGLLGITGAKDVYRCIRDINLYGGPRTLPLIMLDGEALEWIPQVLSDADMGITGAYLDNKNGFINPSLRLIHNIKTANLSSEASLDIGEESDGTRSYLRLMKAVMDIMNRGSILLVDELETSLHRNLVDIIIGAFAEEEANPNGAQIIFTSHDPSIPDRNGFCHDQVWMVSRNPFEGASRLFSLTDYNIDRNAEFEPAYMNGHVGGLPMTIRRRNPWRVSRESRKA